MTFDEAKPGTTIKTVDTFGITLIGAVVDVKTRLNDLDIARAVMEGNVC